jgi:hypothetical protein
MEYSRQLHTDTYLILVDIAPRYSMDLMWPHLRAVQYARNLNRLSLQSINDDVWQRAAYLSRASSGLIYLVFHITGCGARKGSVVTAIGSSQSAGMGAFPHMVPLAFANVQYPHS